MSDEQTDPPQTLGPLGLPKRTFYAGLALWSAALAGGAFLLTRPTPATPPARARVAEDADGRRVAVQVEQPEVEAMVPDDWRPPIVEGWTLTDQTGTDVTPGSLRGKPYVVGFVFTRCATHCPDLVRKMYDLNESVADLDVRLLTVTVDPEYDTPERMAKYADIYTADAERWKFLTGPTDELLKLIRYGRRQLPDGPLGPDEIGPRAAHSLRLTHVDADGRMVGSYHFRGQDELAALRRVLSGRRETPEANRPLPPMSEMKPAGDDAASLPPAATYLVQAEAGDPMDRLPQWSRPLPAVNAVLNAAATALLLAALVAIKSGRKTLHRNLMFGAIAVSGVFLASYLTYHYALTSSTGLRGKPFEGVGGARTAYYTILWTHIPLAALVPVLAVVAVRRALAGQYEAHKRITRWAFPVWMYVSVTGVIIYGMLYHWPAGGVA